MAIEMQMNPKYVSAADAKAAERNAKAAEAIGNPTTRRGTPIRKSNTEFDKNSFLKILSAQLSHMDPTQNQDSSAYVSQMAQFASMEQMANLNTTMSDYAHQNMLGKEVILNEKDDKGAYVTGTVSKVLRKSGNTYYSVIINGKPVEVESKNIIGATEGNDYNLTANSRTALNSDFIAASSLASKNQNVLVADQDENKKLFITKGKVIGAYIDTTTTPVVKIKVQATDADGKATTKTYNYGDIVSAGDLTEDEMNATIETFKKSQEELEKAKAAEEAKAKEEAEKAAALQKSDVKAQT
ncbi:flagellar hook capping FlgD N-terminal domain-containing protein [Clostridium sp. C2-6-12]|uniref:flagellar hook capping FlgD N-terminal domain-containing protein n=1 Tax=Clostridium sp. C2-6-12 TaxID=2698832 RepID=UPI001FAE0CB0|nr:flagellar hook capping FlgD N-terminal domain-containing protein [Clostridium sp. C2-6-12]